MTIPHNLPHEIAPLGDAYVLLSITATEAEDRWRHTHSVGRMLAGLGYPGLVSLYPAYDTVLVEFDPLRIDSAGVVRIITDVVRGYSVADEEWLTESQVFRLPVVFGHDIDGVAEELGLTVSELVDLEASAPIRIRCRGVAASLMMLNHPTVPNIRRLASPVIHETLGGEFNVAGAQCSIGFAVGSATTGWRCIGRSPADLSHFLSPQRDGARRDYNVGDVVQLEPIDVDAWNDHAGRPLATGRLS